MPGTTTADGFGETVTTTVDHANASPYDCVSVGAIIFSAAVKDDDRDGIPDGVEDGIATKDPRRSFLGRHARHAPARPSSQRKFRAQEHPRPNGCDAGCGRNELWVSKRSVQFQEVHRRRRHERMHRDRPRRTQSHADARGCEDSDRRLQECASRQHGLAWCRWLHGDLSASRCGQPRKLHRRSPTRRRLFAVLLPTGTSQGWQHCSGTSTAMYPASGSVASPCQFAAFPGTVSWLDGFLGHTSAFFDRTREGIFRQIFYVHARGFPKSLNPCLVPPLAPTRTEVAPS